MVQKSGCMLCLRNLGMGLIKLKQRFLRKKVLTEDAVAETDLRRCLTTWDLIALGIGSTLGAGLYVVSGQVAKENSGPSIIISFLIAGIASAFAGLCYAEFAARIPRAGSAYVYSYVSVGELMAFVIGWNLVLEYVIGAASVGRGWSGYVDSLANNQISDFFRSTMPLNIPGLSEYADLLAFATSMFITGLLAFGVKESTRFNNIFTVINLLVVIYITICGLFKIDFHNWELSPDEIPADAGVGGFMPFGFSQTMAGAATCFYAFVGFDAIASTGEETKNPQKAIPIAVVVSLLVIFLSYFMVSGVMTLMVPYYLLDPKAPLPDVFKRVGWGVARYIISAGAIAGLSTSLLGAMFPLPRILYAMGTDGVIFRFMGRVSPRFQTPLVGTIISGTFAGIMAMVFDLSELVDMMSIGTLLAYTLVAVCVVILRYEVDLGDDKGLLDISQKFTFKSLLMPGISAPSTHTTFVVKSTLGFLSFDTIALCSVLIFAEDRLHEGWAMFLVIVFGIIFILCVVAIIRQPESSTKLTFKVPLSPYLPALSVFINVYLMLKLSIATWIRFVVWLIIGFVIYGISIYKYPIQQDAPSDGKFVSSEGDPVEGGKATEESSLMATDSSKKVYH